MYFVQVHKWRHEVKRHDRVCDYLRVPRGLSKLTPIMTALVSLSITPAFVSGLSSLENSSAHSCLSYRLTAMIPSIKTVRKVERLRTVERLQWHSEKFDQNIIKNLILQFYLNSYLRRLND